MKIKRIGKIVVPLLALMLVSVVIVLYVLNVPAIARPIDEVAVKMGLFTGPNDGTATDDNLFAATRNIEQTVKKAMTSIKSTTPDLFDVDGGAIIITEFFGLCTTSIGATVTTVQIDLDADTGFVDHDFSTAVAITSDSAGFRYVFTAANESVLTPLESPNGGATSLFESWFCGEGMIECTASTSDNDGAITWYMSYIPLDVGVSVTAQ